MFTLGLFSAIGVRATTMSGILSPDVNLSNMSGRTGLWGTMFPTFGAFGVHAAQRNTDWA